MKCLTWLALMVWVSALQAETSSSVAEPGHSAQEVLAAEILDLINQERVDLDLKALGPDLILLDLTEQWAERSARLNRMEHRKNLTTLQKAHGFSYLNENIYRFSAIPDAKRVVAAWMKSPGHKRNLLSPRAELGAVAVGYTKKGGTIVVFQGGAKRATGKSVQQNELSAGRGLRNSSLNSKSR